MAKVIYGFKIDGDTLEHLPPLHRLAAERAIKDGRWTLIERKQTPN